MHSDRFVPLVELNLLRIDQHRHVLALKVSAVTTAFNIDPEDLLVSVVDIAKETNVKRVRAEKLRNFQMRCDNLVDRLDATCFVEAGIAARVHVNLNGFAIIRPSKYFVERLHLASRGLKGLRRVLREVLPRRDGYSEHEVIPVLPDLDWLEVEALLEEGADNGHLGPLAIVESDLEDAVDGHYPHDQEGTNRPTACIKTFLAVHIEVDGFTEHIENCRCSPELFPSTDFPFFGHIIIF